MRAFRLRGLAAVNARSTGKSASARDTLHNQLVLPDFNGDGFFDVATTKTAWCCGGEPSGSSAALLLLGDVQAAFTLVPLRALGDNGAAVAIGDWNGDFKLDLASFSNGAAPPRVPRPVATTAAADWHGSHRRHSGILGRKLREGRPEDRDRS